MCLYCVLTCNVSFLFTSPSFPTSRIFIVQIPPYFVSKHMYVDVDTLFQRSIIFVGLLDAGRNAFPMEKNQTEKISPRKSGGAGWGGAGRVKQGWAGREAGLLPCTQMQLPTKGPIDLDRPPPPTRPCNMQHNAVAPSSSSPSPMSLLGGFPLSYGGVPCWPSSDWF